MWFQFKEGDIRPVHVNEHEPILIAKLRPGQVGGVTGKYKKFVLCNLHNLNLNFVKIYIVNICVLEWTVPQLSIMIIYNCTWSILIQ